MMENLMGDMEQHQQKLVEKLTSIEVNETLEGITIRANASGVIQDINIDDTLASNENKDQLEDVLLVAMNNIMVKIKTEEAKVSQDMIKNIMPPGLGGLFG